MRLVIVGGGGFRVPLVYRALLGEQAQPITEVVLYDTDRARAVIVGGVLADLARRPAPGRAPSVRIADDLNDALIGADFVFFAVRPGGVAGRVLDERIALRHGVLRQETVGAGGIAFGLRTVPVALDLARRVDERAPQAWTITFTNPAGLVTEAMRTVLGDRVIGICDSPSGLIRRVATVLGAEEVDFDYVGLNHLGWLRSVTVDGRDLLPGLLADEARLARIEEGRLFGAPWLRALGAIPNEYLHYFYFAREALRSIQTAPRTRGEYLAEQQDGFYARLGQYPTDPTDPTDPTGPAGPAAQWDHVRGERDASYLAEARHAAGAGERDAADLSSGGYEHIALQLMLRLAGSGSDLGSEAGSRADSDSGSVGKRPLVLNVANAAAVTELDDDAVIEVPCSVDPTGVRARPVARLTDHQAGLMRTVKAVERAVVEAATTGSSAAALRAFALHPLVDSVTVARALLADYRTALPELGYLR
ncbi:hypothetical protein M6D93_00450 [Jatrophihabitans telluris]|uniref:Glycosyl hydrolase family 4 C-terminal domain-containing protein n=1 Tax=Jatrophihabitans telluris TaxID=2038343 RepID=A0ABY4QYA6_9ACTN|nr:hypothetical protein [Jatrophihabitans telluris]UQX88490.1 hypothetical protein M6D93_00450 [Jatrophihabitans telluris]